MNAKTWKNLSSALGDPAGGPGGGMIDPCPSDPVHDGPNNHLHPAVIPTPEETSEDTHQPIPPINVFSTKLSQTQDRP